MNADVVLGAWLTELARDEPDLAMIAALEAEAEADGWHPVDALQVLLAAPGFDTDLHPRGKDGKFIEKLGLVQLLGEVRTPDGRKVNLKGRRGRVEGIQPDPATPGRPNIRVSVLDNQGRPGPSVNVKPDGLIQAPEKARLDTPMGKPQTPRAPQAPPDPDAPQGEFARLRDQQRRADSKARSLNDTELERQSDTSNVVWRQAIAAEQENRAKRRAADEARRQALIDDVNAQAAQLSTTDAQARAEGLDEILAKLRFSIIDTDKVHDQIYPPGESGRWSPERTAQHEQMWQELLANVEAAGVPKDHDAFVLGGLPGAGKSFSLRPGQKADQFGVRAWETNQPTFEGATHVSINPDIVKEMLIANNMLPEGLSDDLKPMEKVTFLHEESSYLAKLFSQRLGEEGYNIVLDNTFDSEGGMLKRMTPLAREGYQFRALFVDIPIDESKASAKKRYIDAALTPEGGRFVPSSVQGNRASSKGNLSKNRDAFDAMVEADWFTDYMAIDNTGVMSRNPKGEITAQGKGDGSAAGAYLPDNDKNPVKQGPKLPTPAEAPPTIDVGAPLAV